MPNMTKKTGKSNNPDNLIDLWPQVHGFLFVPTTEKEYDRMVKLLNEVLDAGGADEKHSLASLADVIGRLIETYEDKHYPMPKGSPVDVLQSLMKEQGLRQGDLPEIGNQAKVSEILAGKRQLNTRQIKALSEHFGVSPAVFI